MAWVHENEFPKPNILSSLEHGKIYILTDTYQVMEQDLYNMRWNYKSIMWE